MTAINIILSRPPGPDSDFVEVETDDGRSVRVGEWVTRPDGLHALRIVELPDAAARIVELGAEVVALRAGSEYYGTRGQTLDAEVSRLHNAATLIAQERDGLSRQVAGLEAEVADLRRNLSAAESMHAGSSEARDAAIDERDRAQRAREGLNAVALAAWRLIKMTPHDPARCVPGMAGGRCYLCELAAAVSALPPEVEA